MQQGYHSTEQIAAFSELQSSTSKSRLGRFPKTLAALDWIMVAYRLVAPSLHECFLFLFLNHGESDHGNDDVLNCEYLP
jgi:hypothetical protein